MHISEEVSCGPMLRERCQGPIAIKTDELGMRGSRTYLEGLP